MCAMQSYISIGTDYFLTEAAGDTLLEYLF